jgi:hypothetical protein
LDVGSGMEPSILGEHGQMPGERDEAHTLGPLQAAAITFRIAFGPRAVQERFDEQQAGPCFDRLA